MWRGGCELGGGTGDVVGGGAGYVRGKATGYRYVGSGWAGTGDGGGAENVVEWQLSDLSVNRFPANAACLFAPYACSNCHGASWLEVKQRLNNLASCTRGCFKCNRFKRAQQRATRE